MDPVRSCALSGGNMENSELVVGASNLVKSERDGRSVVRFQVRMLDSPTGGMTPVEAVTVEYDRLEMERLRLDLENQRLNDAERVDFGRKLAQLLFPDGTPRQTLVEN